MSGWLIDTNVLSELRRRAPDPRVVAFVSGLRQSETFMSVVTLAEMQYGADMHPDEDKRQQLWSWIEHDIMPFFGDRILSIDAAIFYRWKVLFAATAKAGRTYSAPDLLIAATALKHNLVVVTRDAQPFHAAKAHVQNPWDER